MSIRNIDDQKNELLENIQTITKSNTISELMEICNNNFRRIAEYGGGPDGQKGDKGDQGIPTKPKVPIHAWVKGKEYTEEKLINNTFTLIHSEDLTNNKYQEGHLIMLENGHVYILEIENNSFTLNPNFIIALQTFDPDTVLDGKTAYVHIAYADSPDGSKNFITDDNLRLNNKIETDTPNGYSTPYYDAYSNENTSYTSNKLYIGIYSDNDEKSKNNPIFYTWIRLRNFVYNVSLSNPISIIPVDENNLCTTTNNDSTYVYIYDNISDISNYEKVSISLPDNNDVNSKYFTTAKENGISKVIFNPIVNNKPFDFKSNTQYKLPITLSYSLNQDINEDNNEDIFTTVVNWTLIPNKNIDVKVFVNHNIVDTSISNTHTFEVGYCLTSSNNDKKFIDKSDESTNNRGYKIILTNNIENLNNVVDDWKKATYTFDENDKCYVVLVDPKNSSDKNDWKIIDYTSITTIKSPTYLELTKEHIILPYNIDGTKIHPDYIYPIQSQMLLYSGNVLVDNNIEYKFKKIDYVTNDENNDIISIDYDITDKITIEKDGKFYIPTDIIDGNTEIVCIASYNGNDFQKTLFIELKETPYKLELNENILHRNSRNKITIDELIVNVKYYMDGKWKTSKNQEDTNVCIKASWRRLGEDKDYTETLKIKNNGEYSHHYLRIDKTNFLYDTSVESVKINCYKTENDTNILFNETISIIKDVITDLELKNLEIEDVDNENIRTIFNVKGGEILMQVGNCGIKITSEGIQKTTDGETWIDISTIIV